MSDSQTALVTGGGTGIGAAVARRLAADGFDVIVAGRRRDKLDAVVDEIGERARALVMDVSDAESVRAGFAQIDRHVGGQVRCTPNRLGQILDGDELPVGEDHGPLHGV